LKVLGKNLEADVAARSTGDQAAHIVPAGDWARTARSLEVKSAIANSQAKVREFLPGGINSSYNGFWAKAGHLGTHTDRYFLKMWQVLQNANTENGVVSALSRLRGLLPY
jgi:hypothetical protein